MINTVIDLPFALPTIVAGLVLLALYSPRSPIGIHLAFTRWAIFMALLFVTLPFVVRTVQPVLLELDTEMEEAARSLGASEFTIFRRIVLPNILPGILSGIALAFARAVGEIGSLVLISGNNPFHTEVASVYVLNQVHSGNRAGAASVAVVLLAISFADPAARRRHPPAGDEARACVGSGSAAVALGYLGIVLLGPLAMIFWKTFEHGFGPFWNALTAPRRLMRSRTR